MKTYRGCLKIFINTAEESLVGDVILVELVEGLEEDQVRRFGGARGQAFTLTSQAFHVIHEI